MSVKRTALFISPHLDDVAFSCGGTLIALARANWKTHLCTIFTASVPHPTGFALACQTDKGLPPDVDYMGLRRIEDMDFAQCTGVEVVTHLDFREAPHRGYESAARLFGDVNTNDDVWRELNLRLQNIVDESPPTLIFAPQGVGNHVDHQQTIRAICKLKTDARLLWYRDTPYAIREPAAAHSCLLPNDSIEICRDISQMLSTKTACLKAYATQLGFQFGGSDAMQRKLQEFHVAEAKRFGAQGAAECFRAADAKPF